MQGRVNRLGYSSGHVEVEVAEPGHSRAVMLGYHAEIQDVSAIPANWACLVNMRTACGMQHTGDWRPGCEWR